MSDKTGTAEAPPKVARLQDVLRGGADTRLTDMVAFAMCVERGYPPTQDLVEEMRRKADAELTVDAMRRLHNSVERIRHEALLEQIGRLRPPPGFALMLLANLLGTAAVAVAVLVATGHVDLPPEMQSGMAAAQAQGLSLLGQAGEWLKGLGASAR